MTEPTPPQDGYRAQLLIAQYERWRWLSARGIWLALAILIFGTGLVVLLTPTAGYDLSKLGVHLLLDDGRHVWPNEVWPAHLDAARRVVGTRGFVVELIRADDLDTVKWRAFLQLCAARGLTPVLRLATTFDADSGTWNAPSADPDGRYTTLAARYAEFLQAIYTNLPVQPWVIVLNEPNNGHEWGGQPDAAAYARVWLDVQAAVTKALPTAVVMNAALDLFAPNTGSTTIDDRQHVDAATFMAAMTAAEPDWWRGLTVWNSHPYPLNFAAAPDQQEMRWQASGDGVVPNEPVPTGVVNRGINGYTWELWALAQLGAPELKVFISETGWRHSAGVGDGLPTPEQQACLWEIALIGNDQRCPDLPVGGWTPLLRDARVVAVVGFALDGQPEEWATTNWLKIDLTGNIVGEFPVMGTRQRLQQK